MRSLFALVIALVSAGALLAVASSALQLAPTSSSQVLYRHDVSSPAYAQSFAQLRSNAFIPTWNGSDARQYTGVSIHVFTTIRDTGVYWTLSFQVQCNQATIAAGSSNVHAYGGSPTASAWATLAFPAPLGNATKDRSCSVIVARTGGEGGSSLYWVSESSNVNVHGLVVWGQPPGSSAPAVPPPGSPPPPAAEDPANPPPPAGPPPVDYTPAIFVGVGLLVVGLIVLVARR